MNGDELYKKRDEILGEIHSDMKHMIKWTDEHDRKDDSRFSEINKKLLWGGLAILVIASASGVLGQVLGFFK